MLVMTSLLVACLVSGSSAGDVTGRTESGVSAWQPTSWLRDCSSEKGRGHREASATRGLPGDQLTSCELRVKNGRLEQENAHLKEELARLKQQAAQESLNAAALEVSNLRCKHALEKMALIAEKQEAIDETSSQKRKVEELSNELENVKRELQREINTESERVLVKCKMDQDTQSERVKAKFQGEIDRVKAELREEFMTQNDIVKEEIREEFTKMSDRVKDDLRGEFTTQNDIVKVEIKEEFNRQSDMVKSILRDETAREFDRVQIITTTQSERVKSELLEDSSTKFQKLRQAIEECRNETRGLSQTREVVPTSQLSFLAVQLRDLKDKELADLKTKATTTRSTLDSLAAQLREINDKNLAGTVAASTTKVAALAAQVQEISSKLQYFITWFRKFRDVKIPMVQLGLGHNKYHFSIDKRNWTEAQKFCRSHGLELAAIETEKENLLVVEHKMKVYGYKDAWLAGTDEGHEGRWVWSGPQQQLTYTDWFPGEPGGGAENCLCIGNGGSAGPRKWYDRGCDQVYNFICEASVPSFT